MTLAGQPAWVAPDSSAPLALHIRGNSDDLTVRLTAHHAVTSRTAFTRSLDGRGLGAAEGRIDAPVSGLARDGAGNLILPVVVAAVSSPADGDHPVPGRSGVYPLEVELRRGATVLSWFVTPLVVIVPGMIPLTLAWVWRLDASPAVAPDGHLRRAAAAEMAPGGRLDRLAGALVSASGIPLTVAPSPETLEAWDHAPSNPTGNGTHTSSSPTGNGTQTTANGTQNTDNPTGNGTQTTGAPRSGNGTQTTGAPRSGNATQTTANHAPSNLTGNGTQTTDNSTQTTGNPTGNGTQTTDNGTQNTGNPTGNGTQTTGAPRSGADTRGLTGLDLLRSGLAGAGRQVLSGPYVPIDLVGLLSADLSAEVDAQMSLGADRLGTELGVAPPTGTALEDMPVDGAALARLRRLGVERIVLPPQALEPVATRITTANPFTLDAGRAPDPAAGTVGALTGAVSDPDLAALLVGGAPPALRAARFLAGLVQVDLDAPGTRRGVVVVSPPEWDPPPALLDMVLAGLRNNPAVAPATLDDFFRTVPPEQHDGEPLIRKLRRPVASGFGRAQDIRKLRRRLAAFAGVVGPTYPGLLIADRDVELAESVSLSDGSGAAGRPDAADYLAAATRAMRDVGRRVRGPNRQRVTLTARRAQIPISIINNNPRPINVLIRLESDELRFPDGAERRVTLPPQVTTERFTVETRSPGSFALVVTITSPDGQLVVNRSELTIRSTVVSGVGVLLTVGAGAFLLLWWANHLRRGRRRRAAPRPAAAAAGAAPSTAG